MLIMKIFDPTKTILNSSLIDAIKAYSQDNSELNFGKMAKELRIAQFLVPLQDSPKIDSYFKQKEKAIFTPFPVTKDDLYEFQVHHKTDNQNFTYLGLFTDMVMVESCFKKKDIPCTLLSAPDAWKFIFQNYKGALINIGSETQTTIPNALMKNLMVDLSKQVENPTLFAALETYHNIKNLETFLTLEIQLNQGRYLVPIKMNDDYSPPGLQNLLTYPVDKKIPFLLLQNQKKQAILPLFTDWDTFELQFHQRSPCFVIFADDLWNFLRTYSLMGVINPSKHNFELTSNFISELSVQRHTNYPIIEEQSIDIRQPISNPAVVASIERVNKDPSEKNILKLKNQLKIAFFLIALHDPDNLYDISLVNEHAPAQFALKTSNPNFHTINSGENQNYLLLFTDWDNLFQYFHKKIACTVFPADVAFSIILKSDCGAIINPQTPSHFELPQSLIQDLYFDTSKPLENLDLHRAFKAYQNEKTMELYLHLQTIFTQSFFLTPIQRNVQFQPKYDNTPIVYHPRHHQESFFFLNNNEGRKLLPIFSNKTMIDSHFHQNDMRCYAIRGKEVIKFMKAFSSLCIINPSTWDFEINPSDF